MRGTRGTAAERPRDALPQPLVRGPAGEPPRHVPVYFAGHARPGSDPLTVPIPPGDARRIGRCVFDYAREQGRTKVTAVHAADSMKCTDGRSTAADAGGGPAIEERIVDKMNEVNA